MPASTLIYYRGYATNTTGTGYSVDATFTTSAIPFDYNLTNSGTTNVPKTSGDAYGTNIITKTVISGTDPGVTLSLSGYPAGVSYLASAWSCTPTCTSTITFTIPLATPVGTYPITVTGNPLNKTTNFDLVITGNPMSVTCSGNPLIAQLGEDVTWSAVPNGGRAPYTYLWSLDVPSPAPTTNIFVTSYSTIGIKFAQVEVTDADGLIEHCTPSVASVQVKFDPSFEEF